MLTNNLFQPEATPDHIQLGKLLIDTLEQIGCGGVLLDGVGEVLLANVTALRLLQEGGGPLRPGDEQEQVRSALKRLLRRAQSRFTLDRDAWVRVPRETQRDLVLHAVPIGPGNAPVGTVLILVDLGTAPQPKPEVLQKLFGLTGAEAKLALEIARGETPADVARDHRVSIATVRSQLAAVFAKTQTSRQAELVTLLARVALLP